MSTKTIKLKVGMTCEGCVGAVTRILAKVPGVENISATVATKEVNVEVSEEVEGQALVDALKKWSESSGKSVELA